MTAVEGARQGHLAACLGSTLRGQLRGVARVFVCVSGCVHVDAGMSLRACGSWALPCVSISGSVSVSLVVLPCERVWGERVPVCAHCSWLEWGPAWGHS